MWQLQGTMKLGRLAKALAADVNVKRRAKGLLSRPVGSSHQVKTNVKSCLFTSFFSLLLICYFIVIHLSCTAAKF